MLCLGIVSITTTANAQISLIDNLLHQVEGYNNLSYRSVNKVKDVSADTIIAHNTAVLLKAPDDKLFGYLYSFETDHQNENFHVTDVYTGKDFFRLSPRDSTFSVEKESGSDFILSVIGALQFLRQSYAKKPFPIKLLADTVIDGKSNTHFIAQAYDAQFKNEHLFTYRHYYVNKQTGLPTMVTIVSKYEFGGMVNNMYNQTRYFDYKTNQPGVTAANFTVQAGFKPRADQAPLALLPDGTMAPNWTLTDVHGKTMSLKELKGKVVLMDFYFIGCSGCMMSINPLNKLYEKYKNKDVVIASLTERDSQKKVLDFDKRYGIAYPSLLNAAEVVKSYHVSGFPTFYFIDKQGIIRHSILGYKDNFENKVNTTIDNLLGKGKN